MAAKKRIMNKFSHLLKKTEKLQLDLETTTNYI